MFVPLQDQNPLESIRFQYVTVLLIAVNVIVYLCERLVPGLIGLDGLNLNEAAMRSLAIVPDELLGAAPPQPLSVPEWYTPFTYMFLHASTFHLIGNMLFLWVFGDNVEDAVGHVKFLFFYLACGVFAGLLHAAITSGVLVGQTSGVVVTGAGETFAVGSIPLIGASGAVAGVIAAYLMLHPHVRVWVLVSQIIPLRISAIWVLGAWVLTQVMMIMFPDIMKSVFGSDTSGTAWWAHIGGLIAGAVLILFLRRPGIPLFDRELSRA